MKEDVLPEGWELKKLGSVVQYEKGKKPSNLNDEKNDIFTIPYIDIQGFEKGIIKSWTDGKNARLCQNSDLLMVWDGARAGLVGSGSAGALGSTLMKISFPKVNHTYGFYFLYSKFSDINSNTKGTGIPHVDPSVLWDFEFPIPPLPEQQYLSQKLTALLDEVVQTKQRLETIPALLKQFRQSVLADAVSGRLTEEWREENEAILTVDDLTKKLNSFKSKTKNLDPLIQNNKWVSCQLGHLLTVKSGDGLTAKQMIDGEIPVYGGNGINGFHNQFNVEQPTIVIGRVGFYCGSVHLTEEKSWITDNALIVNFYSEVITQGFIYYLLKHLNLGRLSSSTAQPVVSGSKIYSVRINLPTLKEQTQIVQKVETYFALADEIEAQVNAALENVNLLTQSILAKAFSGELSAAWRNSQVTETQGNV